MTISTGGAAAIPLPGFTLEHSKGSLPLPVHPATDSPSGLDIGHLLQDTGHVTLDPGFVNTAACTSAITYIDGDAGILRYRGYPIDQLAEQSLVPGGRLPADLRRAADQRAAGSFTARISEHTLLHEDMRGFFAGFPRDAHPMAVLSSAVSALSTFYQDSLDPFDDEHVEISTVRLLAKLPTIAAYAYKKSIGQPFLYPDNSLGYVENFLRMTFGVPAHPVRGRPGPRAGARHAVPAARRPRAELLDVDRAPRRLQPRQPFRLGVGRGQRALRAAARRRQPGRAGDAAADPCRRRRRAGVRRRGEEPRSRREADGLRPPRLQELRPARGDREEGGQESSRARRQPDPLLDIAMKLEEIALADDYFTERKLYPNVDFYTGLIYKAMGFPTEMFTVLFALGRLPGWIAQWREMMPTRPPRSAGPARSTSASRSVTSRSSTARRLEG